METAAPTSQVSDIAMKTPQPCKMPSGIQGMVEHDIVTKKGTQSNPMKVHCQFLNNCQIFLELSVFLSSEICLGSYCGRRKVSHFAAASRGCRLAVGTG